MASVEYSDYHKFIVSLGVVLLAFSVLGPWLFLREPFDLMVEAQKLRSLTPEAQYLVTTRQHIVAAIMRLLP